MTASHLKNHRGDFRAAAVRKIVGKSSVKIGENFPEDGIFSEDIEGMNRVMARVAVTDEHIHVLTDALCPESRFREADRH